MTPDPRIDDYIERAGPFARPILAHLRRLVHEAVSGVDETIKWGMPHFLYKGKNIAGFAAFKAHASFTIHGEGAANVEREPQEGMGHFGKLAGLDDLPGDNVLKDRLQAAVERIEAHGTALARKPAKSRVPKPELPVPPELEAALAKVPAARVAFDAFSASHRREYVEWISQAKRPETRDRRIAEAIAWLAEGKKRNWKYERG